MSPPQSQPSVAFFDFDGTLTTRDTLMPFLMYVSGQPRYYRKLIKVSPVLAGYFAKLIRNDVAKQHVLKEYLGGMPMPELRGLGESFADFRVPSMLREQGLDRLRWHKERGDICVLVSASLDVYLENWSDSWGFDGLICSSLAVDENGCVTGKLAGANCHGQEKVVRVRSWLKEYGRSVTTFSYGDSSADIPLLQSVDQGRLWNSRAGRFEPVSVS